VSLRGACIDSGGHHMVAILSGNGLGLDSSSIATLGTVEEPVEDGFGQGVTAQRGAPPHIRSHGDRSGAGPCREAAMPASRAGSSPTAPRLALK